MTNKIKIGQNVFVTPKENDTFNHGFIGHIININQTIVKVKDQEDNVYDVDLDQIQVSERDKSYNGWANFKTWAVALWIENDEGLQDLAKDHKRKLNPYKSFTEHLREIWGAKGIGVETPDGVAWNDSELDTEALDELIAGL